MAENPVFGKWFVEAKYKEKVRKPVKC